MASFTRDTHRSVLHAERRQSLKPHIRPGTKGAEIGVFWAHFSEVLVREFDVGHVHLVDPWEKEHGVYFPDWGEYTNDGRFTTAEARRGTEALCAEFPDRMTIFHGFSTEFFEILPDGALDWIYIDGSHEYEKVLADLRNCWRKVKPDGLILGDDYYTKDTNNHPGVRQAVDQFAQEQGFELAVVWPFQFVLFLPDSPRPDTFGKADA